ncbi:ApeP family dehydratase [Bordetella petrii]|jgi:predicted hotdog family 3-hydroxylacyl-ACP dehydratase|uniref:3-hydroxylacyl-ACP dehydratase n=1 Tax=Bordetella petrii (strain ATCC BAA-461 / DSM 12804 / CCUG 43448 / CIP 107267 / Se-1111R) TaxID=340100 RepID=A9IDA5_BORPD|nr:hotdog family protein [Bordetella petrii]CAP44788.1 conserved hypothetical protein [Bordetella petrii]
MTIWPVHELIPHAGEAILLDEVLNFDADTLRARATVRTDGPFHQADQSLPNWVGLEYMAQAVAAWAGCHARAAGEPVALGFLLGTRRYECQLPAFPAGMELIVDVTRSLHDATGMGIFECSLSSSDRVLAAARLNVYRPPDAGAFLLEPFLESP